MACFSSCGKEETNDTENVIPTTLVGTVWLSPTHMDFFEDGHPVEGLDIYLEFDTENHFNGYYTIGYNNGPNECVSHWDKAIKDGGGTYEYANGKITFSDDSYVMGTVFIPLDGKIIDGGYEPYLKINSRLFFENTGCRFRKVN